MSKTTYTEISTAAPAGWMRVVDNYAPIAAALPIRDGAVRCQGPWGSTTTTPRPAAAICNC